MDVSNIIIRKQMPEQSIAEGLAILLKMLPYMEMVSSKVTNPSDIMNADPQFAGLFAMVFINTQKAAGLLGFNSSMDMIEYVKIYGVESLF